MSELPIPWRPAPPRTKSREPWPDVATPVLSALSREERICLWTLRLVLPVILALCGQLIFWMWFNNIYGASIWSIAGGVVLIFVVLPVAVWTWHSWLPYD